MKKSYTIELKVELEQKDEARAVGVALANCAGGEEGLIDGPQGAIMELLDGHNSLLEEAGIEITSISLGIGKEAPQEDPETENSAEPDLTEESAGEGDANIDEEEPDIDRFNDSNLFLCRWPNGEVSLVAALTKREAIIMLDEWGDAEPEFLSPIDRCMLDFHLNDKGQITLRQLGEETENLIMNTCYPELSAILLSGAAAPYFEQGYAEEQVQAAGTLIRKAVKHERKRLWENQSHGLAQTEQGRDLQKAMGASSVVAEHYVKVAARQLLESKAGEDKKPS